MIKTGQYNPLAGWRLITPPPPQPHIQPKVKPLRQSSVTLCYYRISNIIM